MRALLLAFALIDMMAARRASTALTLAWTAPAWLMFAWYVPIAAGAEGA